MTCAATRYDHEQTVAAFCEVVASWAVSAGRQGVQTSHDSVQRNG